MFASMLFADEDDVRDFDRQVEALMRAGRVGEAAAIVEAALGELAREGQAVAELCLASRCEDIDLIGWDRLAERLAGLDEGGKPVTALGIDIGWPGQAGHEPDAAGRLEPRLETNYYSDAAFPFSTSAREALLGGYGESGGLWTGGFEDIDTLVELRGLGQVHGAVAPLVERMRDLPGDDPLEADAMRLGAMFVAVRVHQAVRRTIAVHGLPRPLAVIVGSNESYPFLDAPVVSSDESADFVRIPPATDAADPDHGVETLADVLLDEPPHVSGAALRQRISAREPANDEAPSGAGREVAAGGMLRRLFRR